MNPAYQVYLGDVATAETVYDATIADADPNDTAALAAAVSAWNASENAAWSAFQPIQVAALASYHGKMALADAAWTRDETVAVAAFNATMATAVADWNTANANAVDAFNLASDDAVDAWNAEESAAVDVWNADHRGAVAAYNADASAATTQWNADDANRWNASETIARGVLFDRAKTLKLVSENPFADVQAKNANPPERMHFISIADTEKLIAVSNPTWRTIIALARYGGLRCPSEVLMLRWQHVDFATNPMTVSNPKTEHHEGRAYRVVPIFGVLRQCLEDAHELAEAGEVYVVGGKQGDTYRASSQGPGGWVGTNLRTTFEKILRRAGLAQWPRLFQNLRSSRETELMQNHPIHVVAAWLGNTPKIALGHYLQTLEADFDKAVRESGAKSGAVVVQNAVQTGADTIDPERTNATGSLESQSSRRVVSDSVEYCSNEQVGGEGLEPPTSSL